MTVPAMFLLGVAVEFMFMRRLREADRTSMSILITYAVAILIEGALSAIFGIDYVQLHASYVDTSVHVFGFYLPYIYLIGFALAVALLVGLYYLLYRTKFGRAVRASLQNRTAADLIGINVNRVRTISVGIGVAVTAVGGMVFGATNAFNPNSGYDLISRLLAIVILGGLGSIGGAMAAADPAARDQRRRRRRLVADLGAAGLLRGAGGRALDPAAGAVRPRRSGPSELGVRTRRAPGGPRRPPRAAAASWLALAILVGAGVSPSSRSGHQPDDDLDRRVHADLHGRRLRVEHLQRLLGLSRARPRGVLRHRRLRRRAGRP